VITYNIFEALLWCSITQLSFHLICKKNWELQTWKWAIKLQEVPCVEEASCLLGCRTTLQRNPDLNCDIASVLFRVRVTSQCVLRNHRSLVSFSQYALLYLDTNPEVFFTYEMPKDSGWNISAVRDCLTYEDAVTDNIVKVGLSMSVTWSLPSRPRSLAGPYLRCSQSLCVWRRTEGVTHSLGPYTDLGGIVHST